MDLKEGSSFGPIVSYVSFINFQERALLHGHVIFFLDQEAKFSYLTSSSRQAHLSRNPI